LSSGVEKPSPPPRLGLILGLLVTAQFIVVLDYSIVQIALPTIRIDLGMSLADLQWIISAYGLTFAGFLILSGRASDIYGRKLLFTIGLVVFSVASLAGGLATSESTLIAARVVQGIGAAMASATCLALIVRIFGPLGRLNQALGIFTAVSSAGFSAGVVLGGVLTEALGWRWIFFVNVPIGIVAALLAIRYLPDAGGLQRERRHLDFPGAVAVTAGLMLLVYSLSEVGNGNYSYQTYLVFVLAAVVLASFVFIESRSPAPLVPLGFLRRRTIFFANANALLTYAVNVSMVFLLASYLQFLMSYSPIDAALALVPGALVYFVIGGFAAPRLVKRIGFKNVLVGAMVALTVGQLLFTRITLSSEYVTVLLPAILIASFGGALGLTASNIAALGGAGPGEEGMASGLINTSRQIGGPVGLAVSVVVIGILTHGLGVVAPGAEVIMAFQSSFLVSAGFGAAGIVAALLLKGRPPHAVPAGAQPKQPTPPAADA
jgi:EmrB/QacA subfamily drug resistance transporter